MYQAICMVQDCYRDRVMELWLVYCVESAYFTAVLIVIALGIYTPIILSQTMLYQYKQRFFPNAAISFSHLGHDSTST